MDDLSKKRVITAALNGPWTTKEMNPAVPYTAEEIAEAAHEAWRAGAAVVHVHVRNPDGTPSGDYSLFKEAVDQIRADKDCDVCINITGSGSARPNEDEHIFTLQQLLPELASYGADAPNCHHGAMPKGSPVFLEHLGIALREGNVKPEIEIFDAEMIYDAIHYIKKGVLKTPCHFQFVLGCAGGMASTVENLVYLKNLLPEGSTWAGCGLSAGHLPIMMATIAMGGHLRVGLDDNVYFDFDRGMLAASNAQLVARARKLLELSNLEAATPDEARQIYGLTRKVF